MRLARFRGFETGRAADRRHGAIHRLKPKPMDGLGYIVHWPRHAKTGAGAGPQQPRGQGGVNRYELDDLGEVRFRVAQKA
jgi:hypothetical protein